MKVAIVYPEVYELARFGNKRKEFPPFGAMYLAANVERAGFEAQILKVSRESTKLDLRKFDAVAFSTPSSVTYPLIKHGEEDSRDGELLDRGGVA